MAEADIRTVVSTKSIQSEEIERLKKENQKQAEEYTALKDIALSYQKEAAEWHRRYKVVRDVADDLRNKTIEGKSELQHCQDCCEDLREIASEVKAEIEFKEHYRAQLEFWRLRAIHLGKLLEAVDNNFYKIHEEIRAQGISEPESDIG